MATLPNAIYIGFQKTGTTFLRSYFKYHPDIEYTRRANVFQHDYDGRKVKDYIDLFQDDPKALCRVDMHEGVAKGVILKRGELPVDKRFVPYSFPGEDLAEQNISKVANSIYKVNPGTKIIISIRRQVDWLVSNWLHFFLRLPPGRNRFIDFLNTFEGRTLIHSGHYHVTIQSFQSVFGRGQVLVIPLEYIAREQKDALRRLCGFLNLKYVPFDPTYQEKNQGRDTVDMYLANKFHKISKSTLVSSSYRFLRPLKTMVAQRFFKRPVNAEVIAFINSFYAESNSITSKLTGLDLRKFDYSC